MPQESSWKPEIRSTVVRWLVAIVLVLPAVIPYVSHVREAHARGLIPTGFLIHDMPYYMANAQAHFAGGHFHLLYQLPFSPYDNTPAIYFQPHTLLLAIALAATHLPINIVFLIFSALAAVVCARVAIAFYEHLVGLETKTKWLGLVLFFWGGGAIVLFGAAQMVLTGTAHQPGAFEHLFDFDPFRGLWFLNFGRNLILGTEAYYHALFFGAILTAMRRNYIGSALLVFIASLSHPFTGLELLAIVIAWAVLERFILNIRVIPLAYLLALAAILVFHLGYYLWFLNRSPEHANLAEAWKQPFILSVWSMAAAYALVLPLAIWTVHTRVRFKKYFAQSQHRLLAIWFIVALGLANHDLFMRPIQPLHFTRGYIWTPLFLIGAPSLIALLEFLRKRLPLIARQVAIALVVILFLLDNGLWLTTLRLRPDVINDSIMLTPEQAQVLKELSKSQYKDSLVLSQDVDQYGNAQLGYYVTAWIPLRSWYSHSANTPFRKQRIGELQNLFSKGIYLDEWRRRPVVIILKKDPRYAHPSAAWFDSIGAKLVLENDAFRVYRVNPTLMASSPRQ